MLKDLIIIGAGGMGRDAAWLVERINMVSPTWNLLGFLDDDEKITDQWIGGYRVLGTTSQADFYPDCYFICAIGSSRVRQSIVRKLGQVKYATLIDPSVIMSKRVKIGKGTIICAQTVLTVDIEIGDHVLINLDCTIEHDSVLHDYVTLYPSVNVSGITELGKGCEMGVGSQIIQMKSVGEDSIIGAGAVVIRDIPKKCTAVGVPAIPIKFHE